MVFISPVRNVAGGSLRLPSSAKPLLHFSCSAALPRACARSGCQFPPHGHHQGLDAHRASSKAAGGLPAGRHSHLGIAPQGSAPPPLNAGVLVRGQTPCMLKQLVLVVLGEATLPLLLVKVDLKAKRWRNGGVAEGCPAPQQTLLLCSIRLLAEVEGERWPREEQSPLPAGTVPALCTAAHLQQCWLWVLELTPLSVSQLQTVNL